MFENIMSNAVIIRFGELQIHDEIKKNHRKTIVYVRNGQTFHISLARIASAAISDHTRWYLILIQQRSY